MADHIIREGLKGDYISVWEEFLSVIKASPEELKQRGFVGPVLLFFTRTTKMDTG